MTKKQEKGHVYIPETLFKEIADGDNHALEELYYISYKPLYAFLLSLTLNKEDADDLLQDTYIRVREAAHLYRHQGNPMAWIMKIAKNLFLMKKRKEKGKETLELSEINTMIENTFYGMDQVEDRLFLEELFLHIKKEDREIIIMNVLMGMTFSEIASLIDKPLGTVLSRYHRAMKRLKNLMKQKEERR
ncbi:MAG: RNA polymerase sigma factor [Eubacteriales bacterium]|nr:RNA polymerase sigma factor [Eubacteriales bacterium]